MSIIETIKSIFEKKEKAKKPVKAAKSKVKVYGSIQKALEKGHVGQIFSTERAGRLYVTTQGRGTQKKQVPHAGSRVAKGFTPGSATPSADWDSIKKHAVRVGIKHGRKTSKRLQKKYGVGSKKKDK